MLRLSHLALRQALLCLIIALTCSVAATAAPVTQSHDVYSASASSDGIGSAENVQDFLTSGAAVSRPDAPPLFIIQLPDEPLARYAGDSNGIAAPGRNSNGRLDVRAPESQQYVNYLIQRQEDLLTDASSLFGRSIEPLFSYQHAFNGLAVELSGDEVTALLERGLIIHAEPYAEYPLLTDAGPAWIGSPSVWDGSATDDAGTFGEGVVVGIIDSGINLNHPSFAATAEDGHVHVNPLGSGNFIGWCNPGVGEVTDTCNDKLIGTWEFLGGLGLDGLYIPGGEDENGHGTHVAATAAGNPVSAQFRDLERSLTGVAPRANIVAYDACYTNEQGQGLCPNVSTLASINQAVADGVVDVINYSIGGGTEPWQQAISLAFLGAVDAGIFVSAAAGNSGPNPSTSFHVQPWVASVAASTHNRSFDFGSATVSVIEPIEPPEAVIDIPAVQGTGPWITLLEGPAGHDPDNVLGCDPFEPGTFSGQIAVVSRGTCNFFDKVNNAAAAGATGVVVYQNAAEPPFSMGLLQATTIPAFMITQGGGQALVQLIADEPGGVELQLNQEASQVTIDDDLADVVVGFSSRGPNPFDVTKPSLTTPGSQILAAVQAGGGPVGAEYGLKSGTSMASPHNAGAAALLRALHPTWLPSEIQSALMLTAFDGMRAVAPDGQVVDATPFDQGAGRVNVDRAASSPLVLRETTLNFFFADPATGGDPRTLNLAGLSDGDCLFECAFQRTVRSVASEPMTFQVTLVSDDDLSIDVTPSEFTILPGQNQVLDIVVDAGVTDDSWKFGSLVLTPLVELPDELFGDRFEEASLRGQGLPIAPDPSAALGMPISVFASEPFPTIDVDDSPLEASALVGDTATLSLDVANIGLADLDWSLFEGVARGETVFEQSGTTGNGIVSGFFTQNPPDTGAYSAEAFTLSGETTIGGLFFEGFVSGGLPLDGTASDIRLYIYADDGGAPAGHPEDGQANELLSAVLPIGAPGLDLSDSNIDLDLRLAGLDMPLLQAGTYWVSAAPAVPTQAPRWNWTNATTGPQVEIAKLITPGAAFGGGFPDWTNLTAIAPELAQLSFAVDGGIECGAPWLSVDPVDGLVEPSASQTLTVTFDASELSGGIFATNLCIDSNDPDTPFVSVPVVFEVIDDSAQLQVAHLAPFDADLAETAVDVAINGTVELAGVEYGASTAPLSLLPGTYDIEILLAGTSTVALEALGVELAEGVKYTAIASGDGDNQALALDLLIDDLDPPAVGNFKIRLGHLAPFADGTASAEVRLADGSLLEEVDYRDFSGFIELPAGAYDLIITGPGGEPTLIDPIELSFSDGDIISAFAVGDGSNQDLGVYALPPTAPGFFVDLREPTARVQVAHLAPFAADSADTEVDIAVNGSVELTNVPYGASTGYLDLPAGPTDLDVLEPGTSNVLFSASLTLLDRTDYTVIAIGDADRQDLALLALVDDNSVPADGEFRLRLGHLAPFASGEASAEVRLEDGTLIAAVDFADVDDFDLAAGDYDLVITAPGGEPVLINPIELNFSDGDIISAFAAGDGVNQDLGVFALPPGAPGFFVPLKIVPVTELDEDFEGAFPPENWTVVDVSDPACPWLSSDDYGMPAWAGLGQNIRGAAVDVDDCGGSGLANDFDTSLITPPLDLSDYGLGSELNFDLGIRHSFAPYTFTVDGSIDGGDSWSTLASWNNVDDGNVAHPSDPSEPVSVAIGSLVGEDNVLIRFRYVAGWDWWVFIDNVALVDLDSSDEVTVSLTGFDSIYAQGSSDDGSEVVAFSYDNVDGSIEQIFNVFTIEQDGEEIDEATYAALFDSLSYDDYIRGLTGTTPDNVVAPAIIDIDISFTLDVDAPIGTYELIITSYDVTGEDPNDVSLANAQAGLYSVLDADNRTLVIANTAPVDVLVDLEGLGSTVACADASAVQFNVDMGGPEAVLWSFDWDVILESTSGAWASEARVVFGTTSEPLQLGLAPAAGVNESTPGGANFSGSLNLFELPGFDPIVTDSDGFVVVTICQTFVLGGAEHEFLAPSTVTLNGGALPMGERESAGPMFLDRDPINLDSKR